MPLDAERSFELGISLNPSDFVQGGFFASEGPTRATITEARFMVFDYGGGGKKVPSLMLGLEDEDGGTHVENFSAGDLEKLVPSKDGKSLEPARGSKATTLNKNCKAALLLSSMTENGLPPEVLAGGDISALEGTEAVYVRIPAPKWNIKDDTGTGIGKAAGKEEKERTIVVVEKVVTGPWEDGGEAAGKAAAGTATATAKKTAKKKAEPAPADDAATVKEAEEFVRGVLADKGGSATKPELVTETVNWELENAKGVLKLVQDSEWLAGLDGITVDDDDTVSVEG